ncbi:hypothetical protein [Fulvivirga sp.]|jgi:hypothetical protein|uniref:hypothetical protein n=1 Tax=Fulvivirga sp. TaxID=1931237 RepID=UPI0032EC2AAE
MKDYKLSLLSKRLSSGKCQIKFVVTNDTKEELYGYMLAESRTTLREVVSKIEKEVKNMTFGDNYYHSHLYNLAEKQSKEHLLIFKN